MAFPVGEQNIDQGKFKEIVFVVDHPSPVGCLRVLVFVLLLLCYYFFTLFIYACLPQTHCVQLRTIIMLTKREGEREGESEGEG